MSLGARDALNGSFEGVAKTMSSHIAAEQDSFEAQWGDVGSVEHQLHDRAKAPVGA